MTPSSRTAVDLFATVDEDIIRESTITRIIGKVCGIDAGADAHGAHVLYVANVDQEAIGATAMPDPRFDDADYIWHSGWEVFGAANVQEIKLDNRSMRKMSQDEKTLVFLSASFATSTDNADFQLGLRVLLKLP